MYLYFLGEDGKTRVAKSCTYYSYHIQKRGGKIMATDADIKHDACIAEIKDLAAELLNESPDEAAVLAKIQLLLVTPHPSVQQVVEKMIRDAPYLSFDQGGLLKGDLELIVKALDEIQVGEPTKRAENLANFVNGALQGFSMAPIPEDAYTDGAGIEDFIERVVFESLEDYIETLSSAEQECLKMQVWYTIRRLSY